MNRWSLVALWCAIVGHKWGSPFNAEPATIDGVELSPGDRVLIREIPGNSSVYGFMPFKYCERCNAMREVPPTQKGK